MEERTRWRREESSSKENLCSGDIWEWRKMARKSCEGIVGEEKYEKEVEVGGRGNMGEEEIKRHKVWVVAVGNRTGVGR